MVSIVLWWRLGASVFSSHASGSRWDLWESANPPCKFALCGLQWHQCSPFFSFFFMLFLFYFMTLGFLKLPSGNHSFWNQSSGATDLLTLRYKPTCPGSCQTCTHRLRLDFTNYHYMCACGNSTIEKIVASCLWYVTFPVSVSAGMKRSVASAALTPLPTCPFSATSSCSWQWFACCLWPWSCRSTFLGTSWVFWSLHDGLASRGISLTSGEGAPRREGSQATQRKCARQMICSLNGQKLKLKTVCGIAQFRNKNKVPCIREVKVNF